MLKSSPGEIFDVDKIKMTKKKIPFHFLKFLGSQTEDKQLNIQKLTNK